MKVCINGIEYAPIAPLVEGEHKFPALIKCVRKSIGYSLDEASNHIGCSKSYLWALENGDSEPSLLMAGKIARAYGIAIDSLWDSLAGEVNL